MKTLFQKVQEISGPTGPSGPGTRKWSRMTPQQRSDKHFKQLQKDERTVKTLRKARSK